MAEVRFDKYYRYDELTEFMNALAADYPDLVRVESIGKSYEGRDIWVATITNFNTGPDDEKPAFWVDGNIHATEVSPSTVALLHAHTMAAKYGDDADITRCLDTRVFYVCPRINPDGAEWALADNPKYVRSSTRPWPYNEEPVEGLYTEDIDGDGRILDMRVPDPNGAWKPHPDDPRLMIRRDPAESGGDYYRVLPEGHLTNYDGYTITEKRPVEGLDINRNFPYEYRPEGEQMGAGPYPTSEPEIRAVVDFIANHKNITGGVAFHTFSGVLLRPYSDKADDQMPAEDLWNFKKIGDKGTNITGYPNISVFHDFKYHPKQVITGVFDDWLYDQLGAYAWTVEIWAPPRQAGIEDYKYIDWFRDHPVEDDLKMMAWNDEKLDGKGYIDWYEFDHPQLGKVELGGWDSMVTWSNPPFKFLEEELTPFPEWLTWHLLLSPKLELYEASAEALGNDTYNLRLVIDNTGWLATNVTKKALEKKLIRGVVTELTLPAGASLKTGLLRKDHGQLTGRDHVTPIWSNNSTTERLKVEWLIHAPSGGAVEIVARHDKAGTIRASVALE